MVIKSAGRKLYNRNKEGYLYLLPALIVLVSVFVIPMTLSFILSFMKWKYLEVNSSPKFVGFDNYKTLLQDPTTRTSFTVTGIFVLCSVVAEIIAGVSIALLLNTNHKGIRICRSLLLCPMLISDVVIALCWRFFLQADFGLANSILESLGLQRVMWIDYNHALSTIIFVEVWQHTAFVILIVLSGLQGIPGDVEESALMDGANYFQRLFRITIPFVIPQILIALIFRTMFAIRVFTQPWVLTSGGPADRTLVLGINIYRYGFRYYEMGMGNALAWMMILATIAIVLAYISLIREDIEE